MQPQQGRHVTALWRALLTGAACVAALLSCSPRVTALTSSAALDLLALRDYLGARGQLDPDSPLLAWNTTGQGPCDWEGPGWEGVGCDYAAQSVRGVTLRGVRGPLPDVLGALTWLTALDLSYGNSFTGRLPAAWSSLSQLGSLFMGFKPWRPPAPELGESYNNSLTGGLPPSWSALRQLQYLELGATGVSGTLPSAWSTLAQLKTLTLTSNALRGALPPSFSRLTALQSLHLSGNRLTGSLPPAWGGALKWLVDLGLANNSLAGVLPPAWGALHRLQALDVSGNDLTGTIPPSWTGMVMLQELHVGGNYLRGGVPPGLFQLPLASALLRVDMAFAHSLGYPPGAPDAGLERLASINMCPPSLTSNSRSSPTAVEAAAALAGCLFPTPEPLNEPTGTLWLTVPAVPAGVPWQLVLRGDAWRKTSGMLIDPHKLAAIAYYYRLYVAALSVAAEQATEAALLQAAAAAARTPLLEWGAGSLRTQWGPAVVGEWADPSLPPWPGGNGTTDVAPTTLRAAFELQVVLRGLCGCWDVPVPEANLTSSAGGTSSTDGSGTSSGTGGSGTSSGTIVQQAGVLWGPLGTILTVFNNSAGGVGSREELEARVCAPAGVPTAFPEGSAANAAVFCGRALASALAWRADLTSTVQRLLVDVRVGDGRTRGKYLSRVAVTAALKATFTSEAPELSDPVFVAPLGLATTGDTSGGSTGGSTADLLARLPSMSLESLQELFVTAPSFMTSPMPAYNALSRRFVYAPGVLLPDLADRAAARLLELRAQQVEVLSLSVPRDPAHADLPFPGLIIKASNSSYSNSNSNSTLPETDPAATSSSSSDGLGPTTLLNNDGTATNLIPIPTNNNNSTNNSTTTTFSLQDLLLVFYTQGAGVSGPNDTVCNPRGCTCLQLLDGTTAWFSNATLPAATDLGPLATNYTLTSWVGGANEFTRCELRTRGPEYQGTCTPLGPSMPPSTSTSPTPRGNHSATSTSSFPAFNASGCLPGPSADIPYLCPNWATGVPLSGNLSEAAYRMGCEVPCTKRADCAAVCDCTTSTYADGGSSSSSSSSSGSGAGDHCSADEVCSCKACDMLPSGGGADAAADPVFLRILAQGGVSVEALAQAIAPYPPSAHGAGTATTTAAPRRLLPRQQYMQYRNEQYNCKRYKDKQQDRQHMDEQYIDAQYIEAQFRDMGDEARLVRRALAAAQALADPLTSDAALLAAVTAIVHTLRAGQGAAWADLVENLNDTQVADIGAALRDGFATPTLALAQFTRARRVAAVGAQTIALAPKPCTTSPSTSVPFLFTTAHVLPRVASGVDAQRRAPCASAKPSAWGRLSEELRCLSSTQQVIVTGAGH